MKRKSHVFVVLALLMSLFPFRVQAQNSIPVNQLCAAPMLGQAQGFNLFIFSYFHQDFTDTEGPVAAGGLTSLQSYSLGSAAPAGSDSLIVDGDISYTGGIVSNGNIVYSGRGSVFLVNMVNGQVRQGNPLSFPQIKFDLINRSRLFAQQIPNGQVRMTANDITLQGNDPTLNIFEIDGRILSNASSLNISVPPNAAVIINVRGSLTILTNFQIAISGTTRDRVLFNIPDSQKFTITGFALEGSMLAPQSNIQFYNAHVDGSIVADRLEGNGESHWYPFLGCTGSSSLPTPTVSSIPSATPLPSPFPTPTVPSSTIQAITKLVPSANASCNDIWSSTQSAIPATITVSNSVGSLPSQTQSSTVPVSWNNVSPDTYTIAAAVPKQYSQILACWRRNVNVPLSGNDTSATVAAGETLQWQLGYTLGQPWVQGSNGDIFTCQNIKSIIPQAPTPQKFVINDQTGYPGIVSYGGNYNFSSSNGTGSNLVSSTRWLVNDVSSAVCTTNWYQYFANKYGVSSLPADYSGPAILGYNNFRQNGHAPVYVVNGDLRTQGNWVVPDGDVVVIFVNNGNLTIGGNITVKGKAFIGFVVDGTITVASTVGNSVSAGTPNLQGVFITDSTFDTGPTTQTASARLVVKGIVMAHDFSLQRDLNQAVSGANLTTPAEQFIYDPTFLFTMPSEFEDVHIKWQEDSP